MRQGQVWYDSFFSFDNLSRIFFIIFQSISQSCLLIIRHIIMSKHHSFWHSSSSWCINQVSNLIWSASVSPFMKLFICHFTSSKFQKVIPVKHSWIRSRLWFFFPKHKCFHIFQLINYLFILLQLCLVFKYNDLSIWIYSNMQTCVTCICCVNPCRNQIRTYCAIKGNIPFRRIETNNVDSSSFLSSNCNTSFAEEINFMCQLLPWPSPVLSISIAHEYVELRSQFNFLINKIVNTKRRNVISSSWIVFDRYFSVFICGPIHVFTICWLGKSSLHLLNLQKSPLALWNTHLS